MNIVFKFVLTRLTDAETLELFKGAIKSQSLFILRNKLLEKNF